MINNYYLIISKLLFTPSEMEGEQNNSHNQLRGFNQLSLKNCYSVTVRTITVIPIKTVIGLSHIVFDERHC